MEMELKCDYTGEDIPHEDSDESMDSDEHDINNLYSIRKKYP